MQGFFSFVVFFCFSMKASWFVTLWTSLYVAISLPIIQWLSRPIVPSSYIWRSKEGDLRFAHARQREYCEAVAFYGGQEEERCEPESGVSSTIRHPNSGPQNKVFSLSCVPACRLAVDVRFSAAFAAYSTVLRAQLPVNAITQVFSSLSGGSQ